MKVRTRGYFGLEYNKFKTESVKICVLLLCGGWGTSPVYSKHINKKHFSGWQTGYEIVP